MNIITDNIPSTLPSVLKQEGLATSPINTTQTQQNVTYNNSQTFDTFDNHRQQNHTSMAASLTSLHETKYETTISSDVVLHGSESENPQFDTSQQYKPPMNRSAAIIQDDILVNQDATTITRQSRDEQVYQNAYGGDLGNSISTDDTTNRSSISLSSDGTASFLDDDHGDKLFETTTHIDPGVLNRSDSANTGASTPPLDDFENDLYLDDRKPTEYVTTVHDGLQKQRTTTTTDDDDYSVMALNNIDRASFLGHSDQSTASDIPTTNSIKNSLRLSTVSVSDLNDISLLDDSNNKADDHDTTTTPLPTDTSNRMSTRASISSQSSSILKAAMSNITNAVISKSMKSPTHSSVKPAPINTTTTSATTTTTTTVSPATSTTQRFVSGLWSPFKSTPTTTKKTERLQQELPNHNLLPGFQEALLAQMEQLNSDNGNDPKAQQLLNLKRQSIRESLVLASSNIPHKEQYDWDFWSALICDFGQMRKSKDLSWQVQKGVPPSLRGMVWQLLSKSKSMELGDSKQYCALLRMSSPYDKMIQRDLARTFPGHDYFKDQDGRGQEGLYNVVRAYSMYDTEVGYCQGLAFIVGPLLLNMPDEEAFCVLAALMSNYGLRGHFTPNMEGLHLRIYQFDSLVAEHLPHISRHLLRREIDSTMFASQWFMTLFAYKFPLDLVFRMYDMIFTEGLEVILKFALALLKRNEVHLLQLDFEHLLDFLKNGLFEEYRDNEGQLIQDASTWNIPHKRFGQLEKEYRAGVAKEEQNAKLVETLKKQQMILRQQLDQLQLATTTLEKEHQDVKDQLRDSQHQRQHLLDEQDALKTAVMSLEADMQHIPMAIESSFKNEFDPLCAMNAQLNQTNAHLEDKLSSMEILLIDIKMKYAQSENERDELSKRLFEMKKVIAQ